MGAIPRQIQACEEYGINPIFGCELYINNLQPTLDIGQKASEVTEDMSPEERKSFKKSYHLLAIAYNQKGYSNLVNLSSAGWTRGFYYRPRINYELLQKHKEGLIFTSCCYNSEIGQAFDRGGDEEGFRMIEKYIEFFGKDDFYLELMLLDFSKQKPYNKFIIKAHEKYGLKLTLANDCHYCLQEDSKMQRLMLMIQTKKTLKEIEEKKAENETADLFELQDQNLWMKSEEELNAKWYGDYKDDIPYELFEQAKINTTRIAQKAKGVLIDRSIKLPYIPEAEEKLLEAIQQGFEYRRLPKNKKYLGRIKEEYQLICQKGFASYFLIQKIMTDEARRKCPELLGYGDGSEAVGPGRGCLDKSVLVYLKNGLTKPISEVKKGDFVITIDGTFQKVLNTAEYSSKNEDLLNICCYYGDNKGVTLTKDHKILVEKCKRIDNYEKWSVSTKKSKKSIVDPKGEMNWIRADEVKVGDWVFVPYINQEKNKLPKFIDLSKYCNDSNLHFDKDFVYQDWINPLTKSIRKTNMSKRFINLDSTEFWTVVGLFAGDGWLRSDGSGRVGVAFHSENNMFGLSLVKNFCKKMKLNYHIKKHKSKKLLQLSINNRYIKNLFSEMFNRYKFTSKTKHVPDLVFDLDDDCKWAFLKGYLLSDGHEGKNKISFDTCSLELANQIKFLFLSLGIPASINYMNRVDKRTNKSSIGYKINTFYHEKLCSKKSKNKYVFRNIDKGILLKVRKINVVKNVDKVYDIEVENNSNYLTNSFLVHNSAVGALTCYCLGVTDVNPIDHDLLFSRFLSPSRGKQMKLRFSIDPVIMTEDLAKDCPFEVPITGE
jgi:intein/homing endonuclease